MGLSIILYVLAYKSTRALASEPSLAYHSWGHWMDGNPVAAATGGFTYFTRIMDWIREPQPIARLSMGMAGSWISRVANDPNTSCACGNQCCMDHSKNNSVLAPRGNHSCDFLMQSMEGGPLLGTVLPSARTKWHIGDSVGCYSA